MKPSSPHRVDEPIRVLITDDHATVRAVMSRVLQGHEQLVVIGEARDGVEAIERLSEHEADVVLMDVRMPRLNGVQATQAIRSLWPDMPILGMSVLRADELAARAIADAGADAIISKTEGSDRIINRILGLARRARPAA